MNDARYKNYQARIEAIFCKGLIDYKGSLFRVHIFQFRMLFFSNRSVSKRD